MFNDLKITLGSDSKTWIKLENANKNVKKSDKKACAAGTIITNWGLRKKTQFVNHEPGKMSKSIEINTAAANSNCC